MVIGQRGFYVPVSARMALDPPWKHRWFLKARLIQAQE